MKITAVALLLTVAPLLVKADEWNKHWDISGTPELHVNVGDGALSIRAGNSTGIDAHLETRGWNIGSGGVEVHEQLSGNRLDITLTMPHMHMDWGNHSLRLELRVPQNVLANLRTGDGPIKLDGIHGTVDAKTGDGPLDVNDFAGVLRAATGDGPVKLKGRFDDLEVNTGDGPVDISALSGSHIQTAWHVNTGDGPVRVNLPADLHANVDLHTGDGSISMDLPLTVVGTQSHHNIHGTLNGGGPDVRISTGDGAIAIGRS
jgi:hypothetical protein